MSHLETPAHGYAWKIKNYFMERAMKTAKISSVKLFINCGGRV
jgi:hypothetical protein